MTKQEALQKIAELQKFVEESDKKNHHQYRAGQIYRHDDGRRYYLRHTTKDGKSIEGFDLVCLDDGKAWHYDNCFGGDEDKFEYIGMFDEVFTLKKGL